MIITKKMLRELEESSIASFSDEQRRIILERLGVEPYPYEWSEQDIAEQIKHICSDNPPLV